MEYGYKENYTYKDFVDLISLQHYKDEDAFEKAMIPVINLMFGWPISELEVQKSVNLNRSNKQRLDLVIKNQFVIDFKAKGENLENHIPQLVSYLRQNKIDRGLLISPDAILLYDDEKRETLAFFPVDTDNTEDQEDFMNLLSYDENKNNAWERFSERHDEWELEKKIAIEVKNFESDETIIEKYYPEATKKVIAKVRTNVKSNPNYYIKTDTPEVSKTATKQPAVYHPSGDDGEGKPRDKNKLIGKTIDIFQQKHDIKGRVFVKSLQEIILLKGSKCSDVYPEYPEPRTGHSSENSKKNIYASDRVLQSDYEFSNINEAVTSLRRGTSTNIWNDSIVTIDGLKLDDWLSRN